MSAALHRSIPNLIADAKAAAERIALVTRSWPINTPQRAAIDEVSATCHGLMRCLADLHGRVPQRSA